MKRNYAFIFRFVLVWAFVLTGFAAASAQKQATFGAELRPFDFSDDFYYENGLEPKLIVNRRNGADGLSIEDYITDPRFRNVRILGVYPAYDQNGRVIFWNLYSEFFKESFRTDAVGDRARELASLSPLYIFPSRRGETEFRQAHLISLSDGYFEKNHLGMSVQVVVEFTDRIYTPEGQTEMAALAERNGYSKDGTPIIKTELEIDQLTRLNYVSQKIRGLFAPGKPSYAVAKVIGDPLYGAIAPDAFLLNNLELKAEENFSVQFECLQTEGKWCGR